MQMNNDKNAGGRHGHSGRTANIEKARRAPTNLRIVKTLFVSFFKIGAFTFGGGFAMIPLIEREMIDKRHWIERDDFLELLTIAQTAPGPLALNTAVFVGYKIGGPWGVTASVLGVTLPSFIIILLIAMYFSDIRENRYVDAAFKAMRPAVVALIAAPIFNLARGMGWWKIGLAIIAALVVWLLGISPIWFIIAGAAAGLAYTYHEQKHPRKVPRTNDRQSDNDCENDTKDTRP